MEPWEDRPLSFNHTVMPAQTKIIPYPPRAVTSAWPDRHQVHIRNCWKGTKLCHLQTNERITGVRTAGHIEAVQTIITTPLIRKSTKAAPHQASPEVRKEASNRGDFPHMHHPVLPLWPRQGSDSTHQSLWRSHSQSGTNSWITPSFLKPGVTTNCSNCWPIKGSCRAGVTLIKMRTWSRNHTAVPRTEAKRMGPLPDELEHRLPPKPQQRGTASSQPDRVPWRTMATAWTKPSTLSRDGRTSW